MKKFREFLNENLYHASTTPQIEKYRPMTHFGTRSSALVRATDKTKGSKWTPGIPTTSLHTIHLKKGKIFHTDDIEDHSPHNVADHLRDKGLFSAKEHHQITKHFDKINTDLKKYWHPTTPEHFKSVHKKAEVEQNEHLAKSIREKGYHTLQYKNKHEGKGHSYIITDPSQVIHKKTENI